MTFEPDNLPGIPRVANCDHKDCYGPVLRKTREHRHLVRSGRGMGAADGRTEVMARSSLAHSIASRHLAGRVEQIDTTSSLGLQARVGDVHVVRGTNVGERDRRAVIEEVHGADGRTPYLVSMDRRSRRTGPLLLPRLRHTLKPA